MISILSNCMILVNLLIILVSQFQICKMETNLSTMEILKSIHVWKTFLSFIYLPRLLQSSKIVPKTFRERCAIDIPLKAEYFEVSYSLHVDL